MSRNALLASLDADWSHRGPPPEGITLENLRRRGLDMLRIHVPAAPGPRRHHRIAHTMATVMATAAGYLLAGPLAGAAFGTVYLIIGLSKTRRSDLTGWTLTVQGERMLIAPESRNPERATPTILPLAAVDGVTVVTGDGIVAEEACLRLEAGADSAELGHGLPADSLQWLRSYLALEVAGLTWRPLSRAVRAGLDGTPNEDPTTDTLTDRAAGAASGASELQSPTIGAAVSPKIARLYLAEASEHMQRLGNAIERGEPVAIRREAHWLKSTGANIGARRLSNLAQRLELEALDNALDERAERFAGIVDEHERIIAALEQCIAAGEQSDGSGLPTPPRSLPRFRLNRRQSNGDPSKGRTADGPTATTNNAAEAAPPPRETFAAHVLIVDDSLVNQEVAAEMLAALGCTVTKADNGQIALEKLATDQFDLVLMDCLMPMMDGFEATRLIRALEHERGGPHVPIVALTGNTSPTDRERCHAAGMDGLIGKPLAEEELEHTLEEWVAGPRRAAVRS